MSNLAFFFDVKIRANKYTQLVTKKYKVIKKLSLLDHQQLLVCCKITIIAINEFGAKTRVSLSLAALDN